MSASPVVARLDRWRHRIPFWWWLTYDALVGLTVALGIPPSNPAFALGLAVLSIAVAIDVCEFIVKRPGALAVTTSDRIQAVASEKAVPAPSEGET